MFDQITVLELASVLAGPSVGQFFAELGAEVIKIENPSTYGDVTRSWLAKNESPNNGISSYFSSVNWGKKSVELDLTQRGQREKFYALVSKSDIVITSYKPGDDKKLKVDYEQLRKIKPDIIYGHITGYGENDNRVGYDAVIQAESGFMSINGEKAGEPLKMPVALIDILAAHHLKEGLLVALLKKLSLCEGSYITVSLIDAAVSSLANQGTNWLVGKNIPQRSGNEHPNIAPYGDVYQTSDGKQLILAVGNDKQFSSLCMILGEPLDKDLRFVDNKSRVENRKALKKLLEFRISVCSSEALIRELNESKVPAGLIKRIDEVMDSGPESWFHQSTELTGLRNFTGLPADFEELNLSPPPFLGQHTEEILSDLK